MANAPFPRCTWRGAGWGPRRVAGVPSGAPPPLDAPVPVPLDGPLRLLWAGTFSIRKGAHLLLEAVEGLGHGPQRLQIDVYGAQGLPAERVAAAPAAVRFHGSIPRPELLRRMQAAHALIFPTLCDGFGLVVNEAFSQGLPVVTTRRAGAADLVREGENGWLIEAGDAGAIAAAIERLEGDREGLAALRPEALRLRRGLKTNYTDVRLSAMEDFVGRGDRRLAPVIEAAWRSGAGLDAWFEAADRTYAAWTEAIEAAGLGGRYRALEMGAWSSTEALSSQDLEAFCAQPLPWDHIDSGVDKGWLADDLRQALAAAVVPDCSFEGCSSCGVCGPELGHNVVIPPPAIPELLPQRPPASERMQRLRFRFAKTGSLALLSHLDLVRLMERALRRSGVPVSFTGGFHPLPRVQFALALPLGAEAAGEWMDVEMAEWQDPAWVCQRLQEQLPPQFALQTVLEVPVSGVSLSQELVAATWSLVLRPEPSVAALGAAPLVSLAQWEGSAEALRNAGEWIWEDTDKKGRPRSRDCRPYLQDLRVAATEDPAAVSLLYTAEIDAAGRSLRPEQLQYWFSQQLAMSLNMVSLRRESLQLRQG